MMKNSPKKHRSQIEEDETQAYDDSEDETHCKGLPEADISKLPPHLFERLKKIKCAVGDEEGLTAEDLESASNGDGEVWLIQCPKYLDPSALFSGKKISLGEDDISVLNTISDNEDFDLDRIVNNKNPKEKTKSTYEALALPSKGDLDSLITLVPDSEGNRRIVAASLSGSIIVRQSIDDIPITELVPRPTGKKQLPPGLKYHHPIYGTDYDVINKPDSEDEYYSKKSHKKRKNKSYDDSYSSPTKYNNKVKVEDNVCNGTYSYNDYQSEESTASHKKKKKKRKNSEIEYEVKVEPFVIPSVEEEELVTKKKKSKKRKREQEEDNNNEEYPVEPLEEISPPKPKKHKKKSKHKNLEEMY